MTAGGFDLAAPGSGETAVLVLARVGAVVLIAPVFSSRTIPMMVRTAIVLALTALLQPAARAHAGPAVAVTPATVVTELAIGFTIGAGAAILVAAAEVAGDLVSIQLGLSGEVLLDPISGAADATLGQFISLFVVTLLFVTNAHHLVLEALASSFASLPAGHAAHLGAGLSSLAAEGTTMFALGLRFAAPVVTVALIGTAALAVLARAVPQLNVLSIAFPLQIGLGLFVLAAALPFLATEVVSWRDNYQSMTAGLLGAFGAAH
jgi:flagellar biosynthetic protein FliR